MMPGGCWEPKEPCFPWDLPGHGRCGAAQRLHLSPCDVFSSEDGSKILLTVALAVLTRFHPQGLWDDAGKGQLEPALTPFPSPATPDRARWGGSDAVGWILSLPSFPKEAAGKVLPHPLPLCCLGKADPKIILSLESGSAL